MVVKWEDLKSLVISKRDYRNLEILCPACGKALWKSAKNRNRHRNYMCMDCGWSWDKTSDEGRE